MKQDLRSEGGVMAEEATIATAVRGLGSGRAEVQASAAKELGELAQKTSEIAAITAIRDATRHAGGIGPLVVRRPRLTGHTHAVHCRTSARREFQTKCPVWRRSDIMRRV